MTNPEAEPSETEPAGTDAPAEANEVIDTEENMPGEQGPPPDTSEE